MRKPVILIIDDDEGILDSLSLVLEDADFKVKTLAEGSQALEVAAKTRPDIIILDMLLSGADGRDICQQMKQSEQFKQIPIILTSAHPSIAIEVSKIGCQTLIPKPFNVPQLIELIQSLTSK